MISIFRHAARGDGEKIEANTGPLGMHALYLVKRIRTPSHPLRAIEFFLIQSTAGVALHK